MSCNLGQGKERERKERRYLVENNKQVLLCKFCKKVLHVWHCSGFSYATWTIINSIVL